MRDFSFEACWEGYQLSKLLITYRIILGVDLIDFQQGRGVALLDTWLARLSALVPEDCVSLLH